MKNTIHTNMLTRISGCTMVLLLISSLAWAQPYTINGSDYPVLDPHYTYTIARDDGGTFTSPLWKYTGATMISQTLGPSFCSITLMWTATGPQSVTFRNGVTTIANKSIVVLGGCATPPSPPQGGLTTRYTSGQTAQLHLVTGSGGNTVIWSPVSSFAGNTFGNEVKGGEYLTIGPLTGNVTYYARTLNTTNGCMSSSVTMAVVPMQSTASMTKEIVRVEGIRTSAAVGPLTTAQKSSTISYLDGLGRPVQTIGLQLSPGNRDVVSPIEYDADGRVSRKYLPYTINSTTSGMLRTSYIAEQALFYEAGSDKVADNKLPYAVAKFDPSPVGLIVEQGNVGDGRQPGSGNTVRYSYHLNDANEVRMFNTDGTSTQFYPVNVLTKTVVTDQDESNSIVFTDKAGRTILKKQQLDESIGGTFVSYLETYTIYDEYGRTKYIISPSGVDALKLGAWSFSSAIKENYTYQFVYDNRGRLIEKKVPGQGWLYYGYDDLNRLVLMQDALLRVDNKWFFIKYDRMNRPVMQGLYKNATETNRVAIQGILDGLYKSGNTNYPLTAYFETHAATANHGYTNNSFPKTNADGSAVEIVMINYFDDYDFDNTAGDDFIYAHQGLTGEETSASSGYLLPTGSKRLILGTTNWITSYVFYDDRGRIIQVRTGNHLHTTSDNLITTVYDFEGKVLSTKKYHNAGNAKTNTVVNKYTYDIHGRLISVTQGPGGLSDQIVAQFEYNELGQLVDKKLHKQSGATFLQSVDYRYSIQGQLASINNAQLSSDGVMNDETNDYFGMEFLYNTVESGLGNIAKFNGNISAVKWKGPGDEGSGAVGQKSYTYTYDKSRKLRTGAYKVMGPTLAWNGEVNTLNETVLYDHNGNIKGLTRYQRDHQLTGTVVSYSPEILDNLTYTYNSTNVLSKVKDSGLPGGFNDGTSGDAQDYTYDAHGNLKSDLNKGISNIAYNYLGKPTQVTFTDGTSISYLYDAIGIKLKMTTTKAGITTVTDYVGEFVYENSVLSFYSTPEGRAVPKVTGTNLIINPDASSTSGYPASQSVTVSAIVSNFQNYVKGVANQSTSTPGIYPISGSTIITSPGKRYQFRVKGYASSSNAHLYVNTNLGNLVWPGVALPVGVANETWVSQQFTVPEGATNLRVGVLWTGPVIGQEMYLNYVELREITDEYQYTITDNQGNSRVLFSSVIPGPSSTTANFESLTNPQFQNYVSRTNADLWDHTDPTIDATDYSQKLVAASTGGTSIRVGVAKTYHVYPGDKIKIDAYAKYFNLTSNSSSLAGFTTALLSAFNLPTPLPGETGTASAGVKTWGGLVEAGDGNGTSGFPLAFVNLMVFDKSYNFLDVAADQINGGEQPSGTSAKALHDFMSAEYIAQEEGYIYVFVSNENTTAVEVYFDDVVVTHTPTNIIQYNEYYPFGLQTSQSWTRSDAKDNNYLYNGGNELNETTGWYEMFFRGYDPTIGRMLQVDPYAAQYTSHSPYNYSLNNPVNNNDPSGGIVVVDNGIVRHYEDYSQSFSVWYEGGGGNSGGGGSSSGGSGRRMGFNEFIQKAWESPLGGTWTNGQAVFFSSVEQAHAAVKQHYAVAAARATSSGGGGWSRSMLVKHEGRNYVVTVSYLDGEVLINASNAQAALTQAFAGAWSGDGAMINFYFDGESWSLDGASAEEGYGAESNVDAFMDGAMNGPPSNQISVSTAVSGWELVADATNAAVRFEGRYRPKYISRFSHLRNVATASNIVKTAGTTLGVVGILATGVESALDGQLSAGDGVKMAIGVVSVAFPVFGVVYGVADLAVQFSTGTSITDRIANGIDSAAPNAVIKF